MTCNTHQNFSDDQIEKNEIRWVCSTFGGDESCIQGFGVKTVGKENICKSQV
jgi:hypothetical protein